MWQTPYGDANTLVTCGIWGIRPPATLGKPLYKRSAVQTEIRQIAFQPPHPQANGRFVGAIFAENLSIFENSGFDFGNGYFDDWKFSENSLILLD